MMRTLLVLSLVSGSALAGTTVETFDNGSNQGGWTYGPPPKIQAGHGNPGAYLEGFVDTFAPQLRTTQTNSPFSGDYRARNVTGLGVDLVTLAVNFPFQREATLMLSSGSCAVYFLGTDFVPQPGTGWKSFDFKIDPHSTTLPQGWTALGGCASPDAEWNQVITNVTQVTFFYGDPQLFYIFDQWLVGCDNPRITTGPWTDLGHALAGSAGVPQLTGTGTLQPGNTTTLTLTSALPGANAWLAIGIAQVNAPFLGGTFVPDVSPPGFVTLLPVSPAGDLVLQSPWPAGVPSGIAFYFQYWIQDPGGPLGAAASNALEAVTP